MQFGYLNIAVIFIGLGAYLAIVKASDLSIQNKAITIDEDLEIDKNRGYRYVAGFLAKEHAFRFLYEHAVNNGGFRLAAGQDADMFFIDNSLILYDGMSFTPSPAIKAKIPVRVVIANKDECDYLDSLINSYSSSGARLLFAVENNFLEVIRCWD